MLNLGAPGYAESLTIRGGGGNVVLLSPLVGLSGAAVLNVYDGAAIRDTLSPSTPGGVQLSGSTEFNMHGGVIENCNNNASVAGGVVVDGSAVFRLCGGTIRGCTGYGGAVAIAARGAWSLAPASSRTARVWTAAAPSCSCPPRPSISAAARPAGHPRPEHDGGAIRNCKAVTPSSIYTTQYGGGVALYAYDAAAELTGGTIAGCTAGERRGRSWRCSGSSP